MPTPTASSMEAVTPGASTDPFSNVDHIVVIDNGAHNIRIASVPYPYLSSNFYNLSSSPFASSPLIDPSILANAVQIDTFPNAIARTRSPHIVPSLSASEASFTAPSAGTKSSVFVSSHIHTLLDDYAALHLRLPHQSGIVVDWAAQKTIWDHVLTNHLAKVVGRDKAKGRKLLSGKAVIITESYCNLEPAQQAIDLLLYEQYGASAIWRTTPAQLVGLGTDIHRSEFSASSAIAANSQSDPIDVDEERDQTATAAAHDTRSEDKDTIRARRVRTPRQPTTNTNSIDSAISNVPRLITIPRPQCMLILDLSYSACHAIPLIHGNLHYPSIRRLELGGKMLINLLKERLSFQQLDMMDESWLMTHIFAKTSFVAAEVGRRVYGSDERMTAEAEMIMGKEAAEWTYEDLLLLEKYGKKRKSRSGVGEAKEDKSVTVTWSLPDYGGGATTKGGPEARDRARYGYIASGPNPPPYQSTFASAESQGSRKRQRIHDSILDWDSSFIASSSSTSTQQSRSSSQTDSEEEEEEKQDEQHLHLGSERFSILEHLFNPLSLGLDQKALPELIQDSIASVGATYSQSAADMMWGNIILTGGLGNAVGMRRRLRNELRPLAPADVELRIWPQDEEQRLEDASMIPIKAGVGLACDISVREMLKREKQAANGAEGGKGVGRGKKKIKGRQSRGLSEGEREQDVEETDKKGRWLTYAQWMNPISGASNDVDLVRSANMVFYPPPQDAPAKSS
ncbi:related to ARP6 - Actin-related protein [Melanopsichium pennsylvanicum]|uniref:Related to ARP6 - Actin-related protein n=2 Tax=Melanopsichium pennsylvanicum TaxID=63383 RepID=A0AAJ5C5Y5_9BASI|nr:related to ARP6-Actin-related protein [Melanopsichium pennsylvanicum 4]SNX85245.1 related to ARP6 - Actin-related protein [Melanopsichium pennsylvanicum]